LSYVVANDQFAAFSRFVRYVIAKNKYDRYDSKRKQEKSTFLNIFCLKNTEIIGRKELLRLYISSRLTVLSRVAHKFSRHVLSLVHINVISGVVIESRYKEITTTEINVTNGRRVLLRHPDGSSARI